MFIESLRMSLRFKLLIDRLHDSKLFDLERSQVARELHPIWTYYSNLMFNDVQIAKNLFFLPSNLLQNVFQILWHIEHQFFFMYL